MAGAALQELGKKHDLPYLSLPNHLPSSAQLHACCLYVQLGRLSSSPTQPP